VVRGRLQRSWALTEQGQLAEGIDQMRQSLTTYRGTGSGLVLPYFLARLAEACGKEQHIEAGLHLLDEALTLVDKHGECWWEAELHRLKGVFRLQQAVSDAKQAEACFQQALGVAHRQQAKSLELRAAMSLSRLWQQQGKQAEARELLAPIYGWFTEGFDTADLQEAKTLLEELS
jgi:predicted ATPase